MHDNLGLTLEMPSTVNAAVPLEPHTARSQEPDCGVNSLSRSPLSACAKKATETRRLSQEARQSSEKFP